MYGAREEVVMWSLGDGEGLGNGNAEAIVRLQQGQRQEGRECEDSEGRSNIKKVPMAWQSRGGEATPDLFFEQDHLGSILCRPTDSRTYAATSSHSAQSDKRVIRNDTKDLERKKSISPPHRLRGVERQNFGGAFKKVSTCSTKSFELSF